MLQEQAAHQVHSAQAGQGAAEHKRAGENTAAQGYRGNAEQGQHRALHCSEAGGQQKYRVPRA